jgi:porin
MNTWRILCAAAVFSVAAPVYAQSENAGPSQNVEEITNESETKPTAPLSNVDRPLYDGIQSLKKDLAEKYGIHFALENTTIYQHTSGGVDPNNAMVNTLGFFATWKIFRSEGGKHFSGLGFHFESRGDPLSDHFTDLRDDLGSLWGTNDSTSDDYSKINQVWWGGRFADGKIGYQIGKIDPGSIIDDNRFAGSGNTQFFAQPFVKDAARAYSDNGLGLQVRVEPNELFYVHGVLADGDAISNHSPFSTFEGNLFYAGEVGFKPKIEGLGQGIYRLTVYDRDSEAGDQFGWSISADQNLTDAYGVFLRFGYGDGGIKDVGHIVAAGFSFLSPFDRPNDQAGIAAAYTHPKDDEFRDEYSAEAYYRVQLTEGFEISGSVQLIVDPSAGDQDAVGVFGLRARLLY